ncbi:hypothetical protein BH11PSE9_BH11PSE9_00500 [soil metagenome]
MNPRPTHTPAPTPLPAQPFFSTAEQRMALARQRFFEDGVRPSGLVSEGVIQSWSRCLHARRDPAEAVTFNPVTPSRVHSALSHGRLLLETARSELAQLETALAGTGCTVILTDPFGVVVHAHRPQPGAQEALLPLACRVGVNLSEEQIGTNAPGITVRTGLPSQVLGGEHFFGCMRVLQCAAAPIRDMHGRVAGVLDVSSELRPFGFDAAAVVGQYATAIENRLLRAQSAEHIVVHLQTNRSLVGTPVEGLVGVASDGRIAWVNTAASRLLGMQQIGTMPQVEDVFALDLRGLAAMTRREDAAMHRLPNGLNVWMLARMQSPDGAGEVFQLRRWLADVEVAHAAVARARPAAVAHKGAGPEPESNSASTAGAGSDTAAAGIGEAGPREPTLRDTELHLIERTVQACGGNVSKAARQLGVSRGLVYRHLRKLAAS